MSNRDPVLARLLSSRPEPSIVEKEALEKRLLDEFAKDAKADQPLSLRLRMAWLGGAAAAVAVVVVLLASPSTDSEFQARGGGVKTSVVGPRLHLRCNVALPEGRCKMGDTLYFELEKVVEPSFLAAYAVADDSTVIWYFPPPDATSIATEVRDGAQVLPEGIELVKPHQQGRYRVYVFLSKTPLTRKEVREARIKTDPETTIFERILEIE